MISIRRIRVHVAQRHDRFVRHHASLAENHVGKRGALSNTTNFYFSLCFTQLRGANVIGRDSGDGLMRRTNSRCFGQYRIRQNALEVTTVGATDHGVVLIEVGEVSTVPLIRNSCSET